jgi:hypothetical protein
LSEVKQPTAAGDRAAQPIESRQLPLRKADKKVMSNIGCVRMRRRLRTEALSARFGTASLPGRLEMILNPDQLFA